ncbi:MAG: SDR family oxidoreductase [Gammaproteobacteria bacterium]|nr:SDR family oxidoreductase [Gammaproteobacteria bacterium]
MAIIVITGASSGIGLELTRQLSTQGNHIYAICRQATDELKATNASIIDGIDLTEEQSYESIQKALENVSIDVLINNAGILFNESLSNMNFEQIETQMTINAIAPMKVTMALLNHLSSGSKILMTTSRMGSIEDNTSGGYYGYRASKTALNSFTKSLAIDLKNKGISVGLVHPGFVQTKMTGFNGDITVEQSANGYIKLINQLNLDNSGGFWHVNGEVLPW